MKIVLVLATYGIVQVLAVYTISIYSKGETLAV